MKKLIFYFVLIVGKKEKRANKSQEAYKKGG